MISRISYYVINTLRQTLCVCGVILIGVPSNATGICGVIFIGVPSNATGICGVIFLPSAQH